VFARGVLKKVNMSLVFKKPNGRGEVAHDREKGVRKNMGVGRGAVIPCRMPGRNVTWYDMVHGELTILPGSMQHTPGTWGRKKRDCRAKKCEKGSRLLGGRPAKDAWASIKTLVWKTRAKKNVNCMQGGNW